MDCQGRTMELILNSLAGAGITAVELSVFRETSRGNVMAFDGPGGEAAIELWRWLRADVPQTGHWPLLLGGGDDVLTDELLDEMTVEEILEVARETDGTRWFDQIRAERLGEDSTSASEEDAGEWPDDAEPSEGFTTPFEVLSGEPHASVRFALLPTSAPWEVPAFLGLGGWNECPSAAEHCAVMRHWHDRYGAEIVAATRDVIEMSVARPPRDRAAALELARKQYTYCADIVDQGCETIANLAAALLLGTAWYFWWD